MEWLELEQAQARGSWAHHSWVALMGSVDQIQAFGEHLGGTH